MFNLLVNESNTVEFLNSVIPNLQDDEVILFMIVTRKKYNKNITDEWNLYRDIIKSNDRDYMMRKIKQACSINEQAFIDLKNRKLVPLDSLVCYIDLSPKSMLKAYNLFKKNMDDLMYQAIKNNERIEDFKKMKTKFFSAIHKSNSYKPYLLLDVDKKDEALLDSILVYIKQSPKWISETRGGYHIIYNKDKYIGKRIYQDMKKDKILGKLIEDDSIEIKSNVMTSIVGTLQGGFEVKRKY